jgi:ipoprotein LpqH
LTAVAAAMLTATVLGACSSSPSVPVSGSATLTVNKADAKMASVKCSQLEWTRTIDIGGDYSGATVIVDQHAEPATTQEVRIRNLGGFTGMYARGVGEAATTSYSNETFTITGTANGSKSDKTNEPMSADFKISVRC